MKWAIYVRVSTSDGRQDTANQLRQLQEYAASNKLTVTFTYRDNASGKSGEREEFQRMLQDAKAKRFDALLFWALDRFTREGALATLQYLQQLTEWGVGYRSYTEQYLDSCGIFKDAVISILATIAKQERIRLSERTKAGLQRMRESGRPGPNGHYGPGQPAAEVIKPGATARVMALRGDGLSFSKIARSVGLSKTTVHAIYHEQLRQQNVIGDVIKVERSGGEDTHYAATQWA